MERSGQKTCRLLLTVALLTALYDLAENLTFYKFYRRRRYRQPLVAEELTAMFMFFQVFDLICNVFWS